MEVHIITDIIVAALILLSSILAYSRGIVREGLSIASWLISFFVALIYAPLARPLIASLPGIGGFFDNNCEISTLAAFVLVFAFFLFAFAIITPLVAKLIKRSELSGFDSAVGFLFGAARGVILIIIALAIYERFIGPTSFDSLAQSRSIVAYKTLKISIDENLPNDIPNWVKVSYNNLLTQCGAGDAFEDAPTIDEDGIVPEDGTIDQDGDLPDSDYDPTNPDEDYEL